MQTKTPDGLGAYLGDGMQHTPNTPIRSQVLASLLEELLTTREQKELPMQKKVATLDMKPSLVRAIGEYNKAVDNLLSLEVHINNAMSAVESFTKPPSAREKLSGFHVLLDSFTSQVAEEVKIEGRGGQGKDRSVEAKAALIAYVESLVRSNT